MTKMFEKIQQNVINTILKQDSNTPDRDKYKYYVNNSHVWLVNPASTYAMIIPKDKFLIRTELLISVNLNLYEQRIKSTDANMHVSQAGNLVSLIGNTKYDVFKFSSDDNEIELVVSAQLLKQILDNLPKANITYKATKIIKTPVLSIWADNKLAAFLLPIYTPKDYVIHPSVV